MNDNKLNILKTLIVEEEHTLEDLSRLVEKSKQFLKIESKSGKIILANEYPFTISERISVFLIGVYFAKELGLLNDEQISSKFISDNINIAQTSISGPLGDYVRRNIITTEGSSYSIKYYKIEDQLNYLNEKYISLKKSVGQEQIKKISIRPRSKRTTTIKVPKNQNEKKNSVIINEDLDSKLKLHSLTREEIDSVFNVLDHTIILNRGWKGSSNIESQIKSTLLYLTANKILYDLDEVDSSELRNALLNSGVPMDNHSTNIKKFATLLTHKRGPIGSTVNSYRLTALGYQKGITLIKDSIENSSNFDVEFKNRIKTEKAERIFVDRQKLNQNLKIFAEQNKIDEDKLKTLFDFQEDGVRISHHLNENVRKILQIKGLMLLGILVKKVYDVNNFSGEKLLKESRLTADRLDLLDSNKYYKSYFSIKKPKSAMQLTYAGEKKAIEMLKDYLENESCNL